MNIFDCQWIILPLNYYLRGTQNQPFPDLICFILHIKEKIEIIKNYSMYIVIKYRTISIFVLLINIKNENISLNTMPKNKDAIFGIDSDINETISAQCIMYCWNVIKYGIYENSNWYFMKSDWTNSYPNLNEEKKNKFAMKAFNKLYNCMTVSINSQSLSEYLSEAQMNKKSLSVDTKFNILSFPVILFHFGSTWNVCELSTSFVFFRSSLRNSRPYQKPPSALFIVKILYPSTVKSS
jgi:hypothetical protein